MDSNWEDKIGILLSLLSAEGGPDRSCNVEIKKVIREISEGVEAIIQLAAECYCHWAANIPPVIIFI